MSNIKKLAAVLGPCAALAIAAALAAGTHAETTPTQAQTVQARPMADDRETTALEIRRVVVVSAVGGSKVLTDSRLPLHIDPRAGVGGAVLWSTPVTPRFDVGVGDPAEVKPSFPPPPGETRFTLLDLAPGAVVDMHATDTIDQFVLVEGEVQLYLEQGPPTTLHAGDTVVLLGAKHKWVNRTNQTAKGVLTSIGVAR